MVNIKETSPFWIACQPGTRLGTIQCAATQIGLSQVSFGDEADLPSHKDHSASAIPPDIERMLHDALMQINEYLVGKLQDFNLPLDLSGCSDFQKRVLAEVGKIPFGQVITYRDISEKVGGIKHVRAVGGAVGGNPLPIVIPCHRVVSTGGQMRGYSGWGGTRTKAWLLQLEGQQLIAEDLN